jgi:Uncharacterized protein conserved in bacteria (DUF2252)
VRVAPLVLSFAVAVVVACDASSEDAREDEVVAVLAQADEPIIRARRALAAGKVARMASSPLDFMRGSLALYRHDARAGTSHLSVSRFAMDVPLVPSIGDPHVENFGTLRASDGTLALEPNDFDAADRAPYLWDVRRLASSMALAALVANADDPVARTRAAEQARAIARATALGYRAAIERAGGGAVPERVIPAGPGADNAILRDVFSRSERDEAIRRELGTLTILSGASRRLVRGAVDPTDAQNVFVDVPATAYAALPVAIETWRRSLVVPLPAGEVVLLDAVRELGSGVSSWPRIRLVLLVRGPSDDPGDDRLLELKELADSGIAGLYPPGVHHDDIGLRVLETSRSAWARPDAEARWGISTWLGMPVQLRAETEGQKNVRLSRMVGERGTPEALAGLGSILGGIVGRIHVSGPDGVTNARAVYARIAIDPEGFLDEQADVSFAYAQQTLADQLRFRHALDRVGLGLGIPLDATDAPRPDFAALLGTPPPPAPLP